MSPTYPDFPKEEFDSRYARARALMADHGIDALLVTERLNYVYFSGHRSCQNPVDKIRSYIFILPKDDAPVLITMPFEVAQVEQTTYIENVRTIGGLTGHPEFIVDTLKSMGLERARIGAELGREQYLGINYLALRQVMDDMPKAEFVDASPVLLGTRAIKSAGEIAYMRTAAEINAQAQADVFGQIHAGMTEIQIAQRLRRRLFELGAEELTFHSVTSGASPSTGVVLVPTDRVASAGETIAFDVGVVYKGYCSDVARTGVFGDPSAELKEFYAWMMQLRHGCNMQLRVAKRPADVVAVCERMLSERGLATMGVGRVGHGVGVETTEYPSLAAFEDIAFEKGMVFACNPNFANHLGFLNAEDNWAVGAGEPDLLSAPAAEWEIPVLAA